MQKTGQNIPLVDKIKLPHQQARCQSYDVRNSAFHGLSPLQAEVSQHHTMDQSAQQEVHMPY